MDGGGGGETARSLPRVIDDDVSVPDGTSSPELSLPSCGSGAQETRFLEIVLPHDLFMQDSRVPCVLEAVPLKPGPEK
jgi:hypothetical protein